MQGNRTKIGCARQVMLCVRRPKGGPLNKGVASSDMDCCMLIPG